MMPLFALALTVMLMTLSPWIQPVAGPGERLETYVGGYRLDSGTVARIVFRGGHLVADAGLGPKSALNFVSPGVFDTADAGLRLEFSRTGATTMTLSVRGADAMARGTRVTVPVDTLGRYPGTYPLSNALAMVVTLEAGRLMAQGTGQSMHPLGPESLTTFFVQDPKSEDFALLEFGDDPGPKPYVILRQGSFEQKVYRK